VTKPTRSRDAAAKLHEAALLLPDVERGVACQGTSLESRTVTVRGKAFLFLGPKEVRLKLGPSLAKAQTAAAADPSAVKVGKGGWVAIANDALDGLRLSVLRSWLRETYESLGGATTRTGAREKTTKRGR
jgi:hypothetical protein